MIAELLERVTRRASTHRGLVLRLIGVAREAGVAVLARRLFVCGVAASAGLMLGLLVQRGQLLDRVAGAAGRGLGHALGAVHTVAASAAALVRSVVTAALRGVTAFAGERWLRLRLMRIVAALAVRVTLCGRRLLCMASGACGCRMRGGMRGPLMAFAALEVHVAAGRAFCLRTMTAPAECAVIGTAFVGPMAVGASYLALGAVERTVARGLLVAVRTRARGLASSAHVRDVRFEIPCARTRA